MMTISMILGSTRQGRFSEKPARWILQQLHKREGIEAQLLDLRLDHLAHGSASPGGPGGTGGSSSSGLCAHDAACALSLAGKPPVPPYAVNPRFRPQNGKMVKLGMAPRKGLTA